LKADGKICQSFFPKKVSKKKTRFAFIGRDFRDYENCPAVKEDPDQAILIDSYYKILKNCRISFKFTRHTNLPHYLCAKGAVKDKAGDHLQDINPPSSVEKIFSFFISP